MSNRDKKKDQTPKDVVVASSPVLSTAPPVESVTNPPPVPTSEVWQAVWASLTPEQRAVLALASPPDKPQSGGEAESPAAPAEQPTLVVVNHEREAERLWCAIKDSDRVRMVQLEGTDNLVVFRRDRALVLLVRELEQRTSSDAVRCLVWERLLQTAPAFRQEADAIGLSNFTADVKTRYVKLRQSLGVDERCVSIVNQSIARLQNPHQAVGETIGAYLKRVRMEQGTLAELVLLLPKEATKVVVQPPSGATLFRGLSAAARTAAEADRLRIFETAALVADRRTGDALGGNRLRASAAMVIQQHYTAEGAFALLDFEDAVLALERVSMVMPTRAAASNTPTAATTTEPVAAVAAAKASPPQRYNNRASASRMRCWNCDEIGHLSFKCPKPKKRSPQSEAPPNPAANGTVTAVATSVPPPQEGNE